MICIMISSGNRSIENTAGDANVQAKYLRVNSRRAFEDLGLFSAPASEAPSDITVLQ